MGNEKKVLKEILKLIEERKQEISIKKDEAQKNATRIVGLYDWKGNALRQWSHFLSYDDGLSFVKRKIIEKYPILRKHPDWMMDFDLWEQPILKYLRVVRRPLTITKIARKTRMSPITCKKKLLILKLKRKVSSVDIGKRTKYFSIGQEEVS